MAWSRTIALTIVRVLRLKSLSDQETLLYNSPHNCEGSKTVKIWQMFSLWYNSPHNCEGSKTINPAAAA